MTTVASECTGRRPLRVAAYDIRMKKIFVMVGVLIIAVAGVLYFVYTPVDTGDGITTPPVGLPTASSTNQGGGAQTGSISGGQISAPTITIGTYDGSAVVLDFIHNGETWADTLNQGSYLLAGSTGYCLADGSCPHGAQTDDFTISYSNKDSFFNIVLLKEPLGSVRREAESFLQSRLGLVGKDICVLNYFVGTPYYVNQTFTGKNLGFSFCPGATKLPK